MATDTTQTADSAAMEDILSSIRTTMAEETAKVGSGSADLIDAAAEQDGGEDDVLELSASDMVAAPAAADEIDELIDIAAFASTGEAKALDSQAAAAVAADMLADPSAAAPEGADVLDVEPVAAPAAPAAGEAADEFDRLLAEISQEQQQQVAASEVTKQALMAEEEPLGAEAVAEEVVEEQPVVAEEVSAGLAEAVEAAAVAQMAPAAGAAASFSLSSVQGPEGVQIAFPAEVLAMALRPMVQDWLSKNLPGVVEKLVKEEISKLTQN